MQFIKNERKLALIILIIILFAIAFLLPHHIQSGDSAELALSGQLLLTPHPPGYPILNWMNFFWIKIFSTNNPYYSIGLLNFLFSAVTIFFIFKKFIFNHLALFFTINFIVTENFFQNSLIPEVFSFHIFLIFLILYFYEEEKIYFIFPIVFILSFAHHLTTILLLPFFLFHFYRYRCQKYFGAIVIGCLLLILVYSSIFLFDVNHPLSWGKIDSWKELLHHFLRSDYGLANFAPNSESSSFNFNAINFYFYNFINQNFFLLVMLIFLIFIKEISLKSHETIMYLLSIVSCFVFIGLANFPIVGIGKDIIFRFFIIPNFLIFYFLLKKIRHLQNKKVLFFLCVHILWLLLSNKEIIYLPKDNLIELYSANIIKNAKQANTDHIILDSDPGYFGVRYLANQSPSTKMKIISPLLLNHTWYQLKIFDQNFKTHNLEEILFGNSKNNRYFVDKNFQDESKFHISYYSIGRKIEPGLGVSFAKEEAISLNPMSHLQKESKLYLLNEFCYYYLAKGIKAYQENNKAEAILNFKKALEINPKNIFAIYNLEKLQK